MVDPEASEPVGTYHATKSDLEKDGVLNTPVWIYSALGGVPHTNPPCWRILNESVQLSGGSVGEEIVWQIEYAKQYSRDDVAGGPLADAFRLRNPKSKQPNGSVMLNRCASVTSTRPAYATYQSSYDGSKLIETNMISGASTGVGGKGLSKFFITESMGYLGDEAENP